MFKTKKRLAVTTFLLFCTISIVFSTKTYASQQEEMEQSDMTTEEENFIENNAISVIEPQIGNTIANIDIEKKAKELVLEQQEIEDKYFSLEEVIEQMDYSMDVGKPCGLSKEDFVALMENLPYDYKGFYERNAEFIWEMEQKYQVNAIFVCGIVAQESGWAKHDAALNNYTGYTSTTGYARFESENAGIEATFKLLNESYISNGLNTISSIAPVYLGYHGGTWDSKVYSAMTMIVSY